MDTTATGVLNPCSFTLGRSAAGKVTFEAKAYGPTVTSSYQAAKEVFEQAQKDFPEPCKK